MCCFSTHLLASCPCLLNPVCLFYKTCLIYTSASFPAHIPACLQRQKFEQAVDTLKQMYAEALPNAGLLAENEKSITELRQQGKDLQDQEAARQQREKDLQQRAKDLQQQLRDRASTFAGLLAEEAERRKEVEEELAAAEQSLEARKNTLEDLDDKVMDYMEYGWNNARAVVEEVDANEIDDAAAYRVCTLMAPVGKLDVPKPGKLTADFFASLKESTEYIMLFDEASEFDQGTELEAIVDAVEKYMSGECLAACCLFPKPCPTCLLLVP